MHRAAIVVSAVAAVLTVLVPAGVWEWMLPERAVLVLLALWIACAVSAVILWVGQRLGRDKAATVLLARTVGDLTRADGSRRGAWLRRVR